MSRDRTSTDRTRGALRTGVLVVLAWVVILGVVLAVGWLLTHPAGSGIDAFDDDLSRDIADQRTPALNDVADVFTLFGETVVSLVLAPIVAIGLCLWQRSWLPALYVALVVGGVGGFYFVATSLEPRDRPPVKILDPGLVPTHSFPSGHVGTATALYGLIIVLTWTYLRAARWWVLPLALLPLAVLLARLYQGAHHLSDTLTSLVYTTVWLTVLTVLVLGQRRREKDSAAAHPPG